MLSACGTKHTHGGSTSRLGSWGIESADCDLETVYCTVICAYQGTPPTPVMYLRCNWHLNLEIGTDSENRKYLWHHVCCHGSDTVGKAVTGAVFELLQQSCERQLKTCIKNRQSPPPTKIRTNKPIGRGVGFMFRFVKHFKFRVRTWLL